MNGRPWTPQEDQYLIDHYPDGDTWGIMKVLRRTKFSIYGRIQKLGLEKSDEAKRKFGCYLTGEEGKKYRYQKGHLPANKGKKMSPEQYVKAAPTMFKKGHIPSNHQPVGTISERNNYKRRSCYLYIKVQEPNIWIPLHHFNWIQAGREIPEGMNLVFKDENFRNCEIDNLELITNEENMKRNTIHRYPEELRNTILTLGQLKRNIREHEEQD